MAEDYTEILRRFHHHAAKVSSRPTFAVLRGVRRKISRPSSPEHWRFEFIPTAAAPSTTPTAGAWTTLRKDPTFRADVQLCPTENGTSDGFFRQHFARFRSGQN